MWDHCKTCKKFIPPIGVMYSGDACHYGGNHPSPTQAQLPHPTDITELVKAINTLAKAIEKLATPKNGGQDNE